MSIYCPECGAVAGRGYELGHRAGCKLANSRLTIEQKIAEIEQNMKDAEPKKITKSDEFVLHMIRRCQKDGRLAWLIGPLSEAHELMTEAYAEMKGIDPDDFRKQYNKTLQFKRWPATE